MLLTRELSAAEVSTSAARRILIRPGRGVLFVDSQGLGDVVQSLPLLKVICRWARDRFPVRVMFASQDHYKLVMEEGLDLIPLFVHHLRDDLRGLLRLWTHLVGKSDLIVCAPEMSSAKLVFLKLATCSRYAVGEVAAPFRRFLTFSVEKSWTNPFLDTQDKIASAMGFQTPLEPPAIRLTRGEMAWSESELARIGLANRFPLLGIQCSSVVPSKSWSAENFGALIRGISKRFPQLGVISFGTAIERPSADTARQEAPGVCWYESTGGWPIRETLAMLSHCDLFVSGDTGLMHMAAAVGTRTISIFGPTSASRRAPFHNGGVALCPEKPCYPCFRGHWTPCSCIRSIAPERASAAAIECLQSFVFSPTNTAIR